MVRFATAVLAAVFVLSAQDALAVAAETWTVTVRNPGDALGETPVVAEVVSTIPAGRYLLRPLGGDGTVRHAQVFTDAGKTFLGVVLPHVPARASLDFKLQQETDSGTTSAGVVFRPDGKNLQVTVGGKLLTVYRTDLANKPYYYPLIGPTGAPITRAYPTESVSGETRDHPHQRSLWFTHGSVNGIDFWASDPVNKTNPKFGSIKETGRKTVVSGEAVGLIRTTDDWLGPDGKKVCEDERVVRFYDTDGARVFDVDVVLKASSGPVTFGDTKEGMFGFRVASSMDVNKKKGSKITNAEGVTDDAAWGKASPWVDYTGPVDGQTVGIAVLNHPESFRYPTTWHVRTYGLFAANPFGWHDFGQKQTGEYVLEAGKSITFRYRVILHKSDTASARIPQAFRAYATPPLIEVKAD